MKKKLLLDGIRTMAKKATKRHLECPCVNLDCRDILLRIPKDQVCCPLPNTKPFRQFFNCDAVSCELVQASETLLFKFWHKTGKVFTRSLRVIVAFGKPFSNQGIVNGLTRNWWNHVLLGVERREWWVIHGGLSVPEDISKMTCRWITWDYLSQYIQQVPSPSGSKRLAQI